MEYQPVLFIYSNLLILTLLFTVPYSFWTRERESKIFYVVSLCKDCSRSSDRYLFEKPALGSMSVLG